MGRKKRRRGNAGGAAAGPGVDASRLRARRIAVALTAVIAAAGVTAVFVAVGTTRDAPLPSPGGTDAEAQAAGFHPTTAENTGRVELLPADAPLLPASPSLLPVGSAAPDFTLSTPAGQKVSLADYRGKTVLLEFFATWCPHCQAEAKHLIELHDALPSSEFAFVAINVDSEDAASVLAYERYYRFPFPALLDPGGTPGSFQHQGGAGKVTQQYGIALYPTFYIIDPRGRIAWRADREQPDALLLQELKSASRR